MLLVPFSATVLYVYFYNNKNNNTRTEILRTTERRHSTRHSTLDDNWNTTNHETIAISSSIMYSSNNNNNSNTSGHATATATSTSVNAVVLDKFDRFEAWLRENGAHFDQVRCCYYFIIPSALSPQLSYVYVHMLVPSLARWRTIQTALLTHILLLIAPHACSYCFLPAVARSHITLSFVLISWSSAPMNVIILNSPRPQYYYQGHRQE